MDMTPFEMFGLVALVLAAGFGLSCVAGIFQTLFGFSSREK